MAEVIVGVTRTVGGILTIGTLLLVVPSAGADTVTLRITGGSAELDRHGFDPFDASFSLTASGFRIGGSGPGIFVSDGFSGETFSSSGLISAHSGSAAYGSRSGAFDLFEDDGGGGQIDIQADPFRLPFRATDPFVISTPFRMTGSFTFGDTVGGTLAGYSFNLSGSGILTATFAPGDVFDELGQEFFLENASLDFSNAQTPEPCTLLLVGTGVLAVVRRSSARRDVA
jgi:hypothetical protein